MYSGGVDSVLCLKHLVDHGITPILFYIKTWKLQKKHENQSRKIARILSPQSPYYIFRPRVIDYNAFIGKDTKKYAVHFDEINEEYFYPIDYADFVVLGYFGRTNKGRRYKNDGGLDQKKIIKFFKTYQLPYIFPLKNYTNRQAYLEFRKLPKQIQELTVSTTRWYNNLTYVH
jgi:hypothetical protein